MYIYMYIYMHLLHAHFTTDFLNRSRAQYIYLCIYVLHLLDAHFTTDFLNGSRAHAELLRRVVQRQVKVRA